MRVGIVGVGSIGSVLARGIDQLGHDVCVNDRDPDREAALNLPAWPKDRMATACDLVVFALPTPTTSDGGDASAVDHALRPFGTIDSEATLLIRSTMPPGSTRRLAEKHGLPLVYSPEFLRDRSDVSDFFEPDRIVLAGPGHERGVVRSLLDYPRIDCDTWIHTDDYITAELGKYAHNALFATKVSFANQMRAIAEAAGADPAAVMDIVTADHRNTSSHLDPMLGPYGGKCLPKDLGALRHYAAREQTVPTPVLDGTHRMNQIARNEYENVNIKGSWPEITVTSD